MKRYKAEAIRNVAIAGHGGTGKTSLVEAMLFDAGAIERLGRVDTGNATTDFDPDETRRHMSVNVALAPLEWREHKINLIDTPGYADFVGEVVSGMRVAEAALLVVAATAGVEVGTEAAWEIADQRQLPRLIFINKMDRENADFGRCLESLRQVFGNKCVPVQVPIGAEAGFRGVVDVLHSVAFLGRGREVTQQSEIPAEVADLVATAREQLMESAAEADDELLEKYLGGEPLTDEELVHGLLQGIKSGSVVPVLCGSATENIGVQPLLDTLLRFVPSPVEVGAVKGEDGAAREPKESAPTAALVFKTITDPYVGKLTYFRVYSGALRSGSEVLNARKKQSERIGQLFFLRALAERVDKDWDGVLARLTEVRDRLITRRGMVANITLDAKNWSKLQPKLEAFIHQLPARHPSFADWPDGTDGRNEGLTIPAQVNYVGKGVDLYALGHKLSGSWLPVQNYLRTGYLWERVRMQGGAYGGFCTFDVRSGAFTFLSYRDPNLLGTIRNYDGAAAFLRQHPPSEEEVTRTIIGVIGDMDDYMLPDAKGFTSMVRYLAGDTEEARQQLRDEVLSTTPRDFVRFADILDDVSAHGRVVVMGAPQSIEKANAEMGNGWLCVEKVL